MLTTSPVRSALCMRVVSQDEIIVVVGAHREQIQQHLDDETPLEELAAVAAFSPYHFHRIYGALARGGEPAHPHPGSTAQSGNSGQIRRP